ncbi:MAG TPA: NAD(P)-dependent alcohol dehydrogenase [Acidobacteriaceae bacterium]|jgi:NADPH:quinone reductase-like Zn-dependent oxidoreductase
MQAIVYRNFGSPDVLSCEEIPKPAPADNEVLIKVRAAGLNPLDWRLMKGGPWAFRLVMGLHKAKHPGVDVAGEVEAVGSKVSQFKPGDPVFGACRGALAEYVWAPSSGLAVKPENVTFEQAASAPVAGWTALQGLRNKGGLEPGQTVLINGAAGGVGTFAVQIAKHFGAEVTGVCSTSKLDLVQSIGANHVIDYTRQNLSDGNPQYDLILDCVGNLAPPQLRRMLKPDGRCVIIGAPPDAGLLSIMTGLLGLVLVAPFRRQKIGFMIAKRNQTDLRFLADLMAAAKLRPVIDRCYPLAQTADALRYLEAGHVRGKVIVQIAG